MKVADIEKAREDIVAVREDPERAHGLEDRLYRLVLQAIRVGEPGDTPSALADAALKVAALDFERWYA